MIQIWDIHVKQKKKNTNKNPWQTKSTQAVTRNTIDTKVQIACTTSVSQLALHTAFGFTDFFTRTQFYIIYALF